MPPDPPTALEGADWIDSESKTYKVFTDNRFVALNSSKNGASFPVVNPANQQQLGTVLDASSVSLRDSAGAISSSASLAVLDGMVSKSSRAFEEWRDVPVQRRQRVLANYAALVRDSTEELAEIICLENGKTLADARGDVFRGLEVVETATSVASKMLGGSILNLAPGVDCASYRLPLGVCAAICPFNFPAMASTIRKAQRCKLASMLSLTRVVDVCCHPFGSLRHRSHYGRSRWRRRAGTPAS
jgi:malonate-semialdehyde dehydrogenase (acetylating)/methylmalonate-semialdehyde dehydrogenase